ncbi:MAG: hypothetical protein DMG60_21790, partial [Acidobacteria bacterium]
MSIRIVRTKLNGAAKLFVGSLPIRYMDGRNKSPDLVCLGRVGIEFERLARPDYVLIHHIAPLHQSQHDAVTPDLRNAGIGCSKIRVLLYCALKVLQRNFQIFWATAMQCGKPLEICLVCFGF